VRIRPKSRARSISLTWTLPNGETIRSVDELRSVIHAANLRYEECDTLSVSAEWAYRESDDAGAQIGGAS